MGLGWKSLACAACAPVVVVVLLALALCMPNPGKVLLAPARHTPASLWGAEYAPVVLDAADMPAGALSDGGRRAPVTHGWWVPGGPTVVLALHGRSRSKEWTLPALSGVAGNYSLLVFDFPGHGAAGFGLTTVGLREADVVDLALDWLAWAHPDAAVVVYGCSMGGAAGAIALGRTPRDGHVLSLITDGAFARLADVPRNLGSRFGVPVPDALLAAVDAVLALPILWDGVSMFDVEPLAYVTDLSVPAIFIHGEDDLLVPPSSAEELAAAAPHGKSYLYSGGHDEPTNAEVVKAVRTGGDMSQLLAAMAKKARLS